MNQIYMKLNYF